MKKVLCSLVFGLATQVVLAETPIKECPRLQGAYVGSGRWQNFADQEGRYDVNTVFDGNHVISHYNGDHMPQTLDLTFADVADRPCEYDVLYNGQKVGTAHCFATDEVNGCTYRVTANDLRVQESFILINGKKFLREGFKVKPSAGDEGIISWDESLTPSASN